MVTKAIILAAAETALLPVANVPLVAHTVYGLARAGIRRATVVADPSVQYELEPALASVPDHCTVGWHDHTPDGGLLRVLPELEEFVEDQPFVLHLGDSLSKTGLDPLLEDAPGSLDTTVLLQEPAAGDQVVELAPRRVVAHAGGRNGPPYGVPAGAWVLGAGVLDAAAGLDLCGSWELEIANLTRRLTEAGGEVRHRHVDQWWRYSARPEALLEGNRFALEGLRGEPVLAHHVDSHIQGAVSIHPTASLESSIVRGPAVIGAGARIRDAYVGPYTSIGSDVAIEGAEIEHSIILPGASISHLGGRLEASVVGEKARVFRDFRLPKALRLNVGEGAEVSLA